MIISHKHRFIFLKVQKTAGTSMELALSRHCGPDDILTPLHTADEALREAAPGPSAQNYYLPLSSYSGEEIWGCLKRWGRKRYFNHSNAEVVRQHIGTDIWEDYFKFCFERNPYDKAISHYFWLTREPRPRFADFLATTSRHRLSDWDIYTLNDRVAVDFIGHYERLEEDWNSVMDRLGLPNTPLPATKSSLRTNRQHYSKFVAADAKRLVEQIYANELKAFDYLWQVRD